MREGKKEKVMANAVIAVFDEYKHAFSRRD